MASSLIICDSCGKEFLKENRYINYAKKRNKKLYCNLKCFGKNKDNVKRMKALPQTGDITPLIGKAGNRRDEYSPYKKFIRYAKRRHKSEWKECDLDLPYLKQLFKDTQVCFFTGIKMDEKDLEKNNLPHSPSLDRIDCSKGYVKGNVRFVTYSANLMRWQFDDDVVLEYVRKFVK